MGKIYKNGIEYGGGGSAGHIILDNDGTAMAEEPNLQFKGLDVTDNSTDGVTEVESIGLNQDSLDDVTDGSIGNEIINNGMVYSTNEQIVGKWIDGKPIYQKTITGLNITGAWNGQYNYVFENNNPLIENVDKFVFSIAYLTSGAAISIGLTSTNNKWYYYAQMGGVINALTIQYTKTTD